MKPIPVIAVTVTVLHINCILRQQDVKRHKFADEYKHSTFTHIYFKIMVSNICVCIYDEANSHTGFL